MSSLGSVSVHRPKFPNTGSELPVAVRPSRRAFLGAVGGAFAGLFFGATPSAQVAGSGEPVETAPPQTLAEEALAKRPFDKKRGFEIAMNPDKFDKELNVPPALRRDALTTTAYLAASVDASAAVSPQQAVERAAAKFALSMSQLSMRANQDIAGKRPNLVREIALGSIPIVGGFLTGGGMKPELSRWSALLWLKDVAAIANTVPIWAQMQVDSPTDVLVARTRLVRQFPFNAVLGLLQKKHLDDADAAFIFGPGVTAAQVVGFAESKEGDATFLARLDAVMSGVTR
ncbi:MAG: hypothetical protein ACKVPX_14525 [Myxococcaceae bacterium]